MDYENKYKEALAAAKHYYEELDSDTTKNVLEEIFPELAESEDERIRKEFLDFLHQLDIQGYTDWRYNSWVAWLEKQGEYANFRNKIQIGDKVTRNEDGVLVNLSQLNRVAKKDKKYGEQKQWDSVKPVSEEDKLCLMSDEQKPVEWSEEDESMLNDIIHNIHFAETHRNVTSSSDMEKEQVNWLKSLRPLNKWKPSEEQMKCLSDVVHKAKYKNDISVGGYSAYMPLASLYLDLKKLTE